jgi:hypothetical protein
MEDSEERYRDGSDIGRRKSSYYLVHGFCALSLPSKARKAQTSSAATWTYHEGGTLRHWDLVIL